MRTPGRSVLLVCLVVLAGCGGASDPSPVTPAPVPTDTADRPQLPPGLTTDGTVDPAALAAAHASALSDSYTVYVRRTTETPNGTVLRRRTMELRVASNHTRYRVRLRADGEEFDARPPRREYWSSSSRRVYGRITTRNCTRFVAFDATFVPGNVVFGTTNYWLQSGPLGGEPWTDVQPLFRSLAPRVVERTTHRGRYRYRVRADRAGNRTGSGATGATGATGTVDLRRNVSLDAVIDGEGLVRRHRLRYTRRSGNRTVRVVRTVRYTRVGTTTVGRPSWYRHAANHHASNRSGAVSNRPDRPSDPPRDTAACPDV